MITTENVNVKSREWNTNICIKWREIYVYNKKMHYK